MGLFNLSGPKRAAFDKRAIRRNGREIIDSELAAMHIEDELEQDEAMNDVTLTHRQAILSGINPDDPRGHSMTIEQLDEAVKTLGVLTPDEREQYHSSAAGIIYLKGLERDLRSMDSDLVDHEQDQVMA